MSHERTITIEADGRHYLLPTVVNGQALSDDAAVQAWRAGSVKALGVFDSQNEADAAAQGRSRSGGGIINSIMRHKAPPPQPGKMPDDITGKRG